MAGRIFRLQRQPVPGAEHCPVHRESEEPSQEDGFCEGVPVAVKEAWVRVAGVNADVPSLRNSFLIFRSPGTPVPGYRLYRPCGTGSHSLTRLIFAGSRRARCDEMNCAKEWAQGDRECARTIVCTVPTGLLPNFHLNSPRHCRAGLQIVSSLRDWVPLADETHFCGIKIVSSLPDSRFSWFRSLGVPIGQHPIEAGGYLDRVI